MMRLIQQAIRRWKMRRLSPQLRKLVDCGENDTIMMGDRL